MEKKVRLAGETYIFSNEIGSKKELFNLNYLILVAHEVVLPALFPKMFWNSTPMFC